MLTQYSIADYSDSDLEIIPTFRRQRTHRLGESSFPLLYPDASRPHTGTHRFTSGHEKRHLMAYDGTGDDSSAGSSPEEEEEATRKKARQATPRKKPVTLRSIALSDEDSGVESPLESPTRVSVTRGHAVLPRNESSANTDEPKSADMRSLISGGTVNFAQKTKKTPQKSNAKHQGGIAKSSSKNGTRGSEGSITRSDDEDAIAILPTPQRTGGHGARKKQIIITDDSEDLDVEPHGSQKRSGRALNLTDEDASEDELPSLSQIQDPSGRNGKGALAFEESEEEEEEDVVRPSPKRRLRKRAEMDNQEHDSDEDDSDPISSPLKRRRTIVEDDSESDPFTSPSKRFRPGLNGQRGIKSNATGQTKRITRQQQQQKKPHRTAREKKLELLRRQRAGEKIVELTSSESDDGEPRQGIYDSNSDLEVLSEFEDEEKDVDEGIEEVRRSLLPSKRNDNDDDFINDDDDEPLGVPELGLNDIPLMFTHHAHKPLKEHFKDAVEWMIQNKVSTALEELYNHLTTYRLIQHSIAKILFMSKPSKSLTWKFKDTLLQYTAQPYGRKPSPAPYGLVQCS